MNTTVISMTVALLLGAGLIIGLVALNLLTGTFEFLFGKASLDILKSQKGVHGLAFSLKWDNHKEPAKFDQVRVRLFNPFGSPTQVDVCQSFDAQSESFAVDLDMGPGMQDLISANNMERATVMVEVGSSKDGLFWQYQMKANVFFKKRREASASAEDFNGKKDNSQDKVYYHTVEKSFIAPAMPKTGKALKLATNPEFAHEFAAGGGQEGAAAGAPKENFAVAKVWIDPGCIVCNACENIYPEVFKVNADTCIVVPNYPKDDGLKVLEAAEACPVEVIKFERA